MSDPEPRAFREIDPEYVPLTFVAFLDAHSGCPDEDIELGRTPSMAVAYCHTCDDIRTYIYD